MAAMVLLYGTAVIRLRWHQESPAEPVVPLEAGDEARHAPSARALSVPPDALVLTVTEVAEEWRVEEEIIDREIHSGKLRAFHVGPVIRIRRDAMDEYEANNRVRP